MDRATIGVDLGGSHVMAAVVDEGARSTPSTSKTSTITRLPPSSKRWPGGQARDRRCQARDRGIGIGAPGNIDPTTGDDSVLAELRLGERSAGPARPRRVPQVPRVRRQRRAVRDAGRVRARRRPGHSGLRAAHPGDGDRRRDRHRRRSRAGSQMGAGEFGHHQIRPDGGFICGCGKVGCFEAQASGTGLIRHAMRLAPSFPRSGLLDVPRETAGVQGDPQGGPERRRPCPGDLERVLRRPRAGAGHVIAFVNPEVIALVGRLERG